MRRPATAGQLAALAAVAVLGACAAIPRTAPVPLPPAAQLESFHLDGRITLQVGKERFPGSVRWGHAPQRDELWFYSPVGSAVAHLVQDDGGALLVNAKGEAHRASDLRSLAYDVLGWDLPLEGLPYWVRGLTWPAAPVDDAQRDAQGRLTRLEQAGWKVSYMAWKTGAADALPAKLDVQGQRLRLRLLIERWTAGNVP